MTRPIPLYQRLYFHRPLTETARLIGYSGIDTIDFWKKASKLGLPAGQVNSALDELTQPGERPKGRLALTPQAAKLCWQLLGPPPGHPDYRPKEPEQVPEPDEQGKHAKNVRKPRSRGR
jgi:hypothetical protein